MRRPINHAMMPEGVTGHPALAFCAPPRPSRRRPPPAARLGSARLGRSRENALARRRRERASEARQTAKRSSTASRRRGERPRGGVQIGNSVVVVGVVVAATPSPSSARELVRGGAAWRESLRRSARGGSPGTLSRPSLAARALGAGLAALGVMTYRPPETAATGQGEAHDGAEPQSARADDVRDPGATEDAVHLADVAREVAEEQAANENSEQAGTAIVDSNEETIKEESEALIAADQKEQTAASEVAQTPGEVPEHVRTGFGFLRDGLSAAVPAVNTGFSLAQAGTDIGFFVGKKAASAPFEAARWLGVPATEAPRQTLEGVLDFAHGLTRAGIDLSSDITLASMGASDGALGLTGAQRGQTMKSLTEYVEGLRGVDDSYHTKEALLGLSVLLSQLSGELTVKNPLKLMAGARALSEVQRAHRDKRLEAWRETPESKQATAIPPQEVVDEWFRYTQFAVAAYGHHALHFLGIAGPGTSRWSFKGERAAIRGITGIPEEDVIVLQQGGETYRPGHFVAVSHITQSVVVSIRGTMRPQDVLTDLVCEQTELVSMYDEEGEVIEGHAHKGFMKSAQRLANDLHETVVELLRANPGYELVITGHSLGAGVATVLTLLWARMPVFRERNIRAFAYGAPCTVSHDIARAPFTRKHVTSIIVGDDIVSRLSLSSFQDLQRGMIAMAPASSVPLAEKADIYANLERSKPEDKLYSAGRVYMLNSDEFGGEPLVEIDPVNILDAIELTSAMFSIHLPSEYVRSLRELRLKAMSRPEQPALSSEGSAATLPALDTSASEAEMLAAEASPERDEDVGTDASTSESTHAATDDTAYELTTAAAADDDVATADDKEDVSNQ
ncbi:Lipase, putative [Hondaea fermentalgiana]|uniref:sn-1-specific diacylglycerol lipase n=1 Tax=Hondaea fermentalgiana TaxID=2315210 RepID=A0A2R5GPW2_9STRA|nr:Lipase, putative [Hondaea fermentalgiana]|eukprot:GBG29924.1 Lipase, putative [Hondaea fermentalgiana]